MPKPASYYTGVNEALLRAVPDGALRVLDVGCGEGRLGAALKERVPGRRVFGIEREAVVARQAATRLDEVFSLDAAVEDPPLEPRSLDSILFGDVLEHLVDPELVLQRYRGLLAPGGEVLCSIPNLQHHSLLTALLTGDFQYTTAGLLDATHLRFFTASTITKLLLDAGYEPNFMDTIEVPAPAELLNAARPLLDHLRLHPGRMARYLGAYQYIVRGRPMPDIDGGQQAAGGEAESIGDAPLSVVACGGVAGAKEPGLPGDVPRRRGPSHPGHAGVRPALPRPPWPISSLVAFRNARCH
jgi:SAM-dependent methyltransferase